MSLPLLTWHCKSQKTEFSHFVFWPFLYCLVKLWGWPMAHGPSLEDEAKPEHILSQATCQQTPQSLAMNGEFSPSYSAPTIFFSLDLKVICSHPVWGLWLEPQRAVGPPQVWVLPISKGWGRGWQRDMYVHCGPRLTFIHNTVHRWSAPGIRKRKGTVLHA